MALLIVTSLAAAMPAMPAAQQPAPMETNIRFKTGKDLDAVVTSVDDKNVVVELPGFAGAQSTFSLSLLTPQSVCAVTRAVLKDNDAAGWRKLADFAKEHNLNAEYVAALDVVASIDPKQAASVKTELDAARMKLAQSRLERGEKYMKGGQLDRAMDVFSSLALYQGTPAAATASTLLQQVNDDLQRARNAAAAALDLRGKVREADQRLQSISSLITRGEKSMQLAATMTANKVDMQSEYQAAIAMLRQANDSLQRVQSTLQGAGSQAQPSSSNLGGVQQEIELMSMAVEGDLVQSYVELGYLYVSMTRIYDATACANAAANIEPNDPRIASLRQAIVGLNTGSGWSRNWRGWGSVPGWR
jgi:tetratricopeptide (TPR) repeat protein